MICTQVLANIQTLKVIIKNPSELNSQQKREKERVCEREIEGINVAMVRVTDISTTAQ